jgi:hypothetical protein
MTMRAQALLVTVAALALTAAPRAAQAQQVYKLTITAPPGGKIGDEHQRIECGDGVGRCSLTLPGPGTVRLWAFPNVGSDLGTWVGCNPSYPASQSCDMNVTGAQTVTYKFVTKGWVTIDVSTPAHGAVVIGNDRCPPKCKYQLTKGLRLSVQAVGDLGWVLESWGADCSNRSNPCSLLLDDQKGIAANFKPVGTWNLTVKKTGNGEIWSDDQGIRCGNSFSKCSIPVTKGASFRLGGFPNPGGKFGPWVGACDGQTGQFCTFTMRSDLTVTRTFP